MKDTQEKFKKMLSRIRTVFSKESYDKPSIHPTKDWLFILTLFTISLVAVGMIAVYIYFGIQNGSFWNTAPTSRSTPTYQINQKGLDSVINYFNQKETNTAQIENNQKTVADPSQ